MTFSRCLRVELRRVFLSPATWLCAALALCAPLAGYSLYLPAGQQTRASALVANPVLAGALGGAVVFALLALYELDRVHRCGLARITDAIASPAALGAARAVALLGPAVATAALACLAYLPYTLANMGRLFQPDVYVLGYLVLMLPSMVFGVLAASVFYNLTRRVDLGFVLFAVFVLAALSTWVSDNYLLRWVNPLIPLYSDDFDNLRPLRLAGWNRLFWLALLAGAFLLSLRFVRRYEKGAVGSLLAGLRRPLSAAAGAALVALGAVAYAAQPFIDHSPMDYVDQQYENNGRMFLTATHADVTLSPGFGTLSGTAFFTVENENTEPAEVSGWLNPGYRVKSITANGEAVPFRDTGNDINNAREIIITLPPEKTLKIVMEYGGYPREWSMMRGFLWGVNISRAYTEVGSDALIPTLDTEFRDYDNLAVTANVTLPGSMSIVSSGDTPKLLAEDKGRDAKTWALLDSGRRISLYAGDYESERIEAGGIAVEFFYSAKHKETMDRMEAGKVLAEVIDYCTGRYGPLGFDSERPMKLIQTTAYEQGGGAFRNVSTMGETYFSEENLGDTDKGASNAEVLAHEIAHQWWGLSAGFEEEGCWSSEGVAVYTTYRMMKEKHGEAYASRYYVDEWQRGLDELNRSFYRRHPEYLDVLPEKYAAQVRGMEWSTGMYKIMPLMLLKAAEHLGGEDRLDEVLAGLYKTSSKNYEPVTFQDFLDACGLQEEDIRVA